MEPLPLQSTEASIRRKDLLDASTMHWFHWLIICLSLILTLSAWYFSKQQMLQKVEQKFHRNAEHIVELVKERMTLYENVLWSAVAFHDAIDSEISYQQWLNFYNSLKIDQAYPGINGIGVIYNVQADTLNAYLQWQRQQRPDYAIHPPHQEAEYWPITYIEPLAANKKAVGLDIAFETNRYNSIKKARDSGLATLTAPITLVQDATKTPGFLLYAPFYQKSINPTNLEERRANIIGVTYAPFIMSKLMQGTLASENRHVHITISDNEQLLFSDLDEGDNADPNPLYKKVIDIELYGRSWRFNIETNLNFRNESLSKQPLYILIGGIMIDIMLLALFLFLSRANRKALNYADLITNNLQEKTLKLEKSNSDLEQFSYIASHDLKSPLNAIKQLSIWLSEDCADDINDESKEHLRLLKQRSERMIKLLDDLLDYSRISSVNYTAEELNLRELVNDVFDFLDKPKEFFCNAPDINIRIERIPFEIVLRNLISNSIKHHNSGPGEITVSYTIESGQHLISVTDNGPGIPESLQEKAMQMFQTLKPRDQVEGSGMGLAIAKKLAEYHHGSLSIKPATAQGLTMVIRWGLEQSHLQVSNAVEI